MKTTNNLGRPKHQLYIPKSLKSVGWPRSQRVKIISNVLLNIPVNISEVTFHCIYKYIFNKLYRKNEY